MKNHKKGYQNYYKKLCQAESTDESENLSFQIIKTRRGRPR